MIVLCSKPGHVTEWDAPDRPGLNIKTLRMKPLLFGESLIINEKLLHVDLIECIYKLCRIVIALRI